MAFGFGIILVLMSLFIIFLVSGTGSTGVGFLIVGIFVLLWAFIDMVIKKNNAAQVTPSQPQPPSSQAKQATSPAPLLNSQISGQKEGQSVKVSQNNKERAIAYCSEGKRLFYEQQRAREALRAFNEALKYDASLLDAIEGKMQSLAVLREGDQALRIAEHVLSLDQDLRAAWRCIAGISWERRDYKRAWDGVNRLLSYDPRDVSALLIKAGLLEDEGRFSEALAVVNLAAEDEPNGEALTEYRDALQQRIHEERVKKSADSIRFVGGIAANVGKIIAQDIFVPNCLICGAKLDPGEKICHVCRRPR